MSRTKQKRRNHVFRYVIPGGTDIYWSVKVKDATATVVLTRTEADVINGRPGIATACADVKCAHRSREKFPHEVHIVEVTKCFFFIADRISNGIPVSCVKYAHNDPTIALFDKPGGGKNKLLKSGQATRDITLTPPPPPGYHGTRSRTPSKQDGTRTKGLPKASIRRAIEAGLIDVRLSK